MIKLTIGLGLDVLLDTDYGTIPSKILVRGMVVGDKYNVYKVYVRRVRYAKKYDVSGDSFIVSPNTYFFINGNKTRIIKVGDHIDAIYGSTRVNKITLVFGARIQFITFNSVAQKCVLHNGVIISG